MGRGNIVKYPILVDLNSEIPWYHEELNHSSGVLIISFSTITDKFDWSHFLRLDLEYLDLNQMYIADLDYCWWLGEYKGIEGCGIEAAIKFIKDKIQKHNIKKVLTIGSSKGSLGALIFGTLLNADSVYAFSPKTKMASSTNKKYKVYDNLEKVKQRLPDFSYDRNNFNVRELILKLKPKTKYNIFYGDACNGDITFVNYISDLENVNLFTVPSDKHSGIGKHFLANGLLKKMLEEEVECLKMTKEVEI